MVWHRIPGYEPYLLSDDFEVRHSERIDHPANYLTQTRSDYCNVHLLLDGRRLTVGLHRLIARVFVPNPENKPEVNHRNGNKLDNRPENLEWVTHKENLEHASRTGLVTHGTAHYAAKLTEENVRDIRARHAAGTMGSWNAVAREFGITWATLQKVILRRSWRLL